MSRCSALIVAIVGCLLTAPLHAAGAKDSAGDEQILKAADVAATDDALLAFFGARTIRDADREKIKAIVVQLGDDSFEVREKASAALLGIGSAAEPALRQALKSPDVEVQRRAEDCLRQIKRGTGSAVVAAAARTLARRKPAAAAEVLLAYLPFADNEGVAEEVRMALAALAMRDGEPHPALVMALTDKEPTRRAGAAVALCFGGSGHERDAIRKLLHDPEPLVQLQVGVALARAGERDAVPVVIDLLGKLPPEQAWPAEDLLLHLAADQAPPASLGSDEAGRARCRDAWAGWWKLQGARVDMARLRSATPRLGYTLLLLLDAGQVMEVDQAGKTRWQFGGLQKPLDLQFLPGNRILVAEHDANRVTERNFKGEVVWEKHVDGPLMAQRLPNGNTFIATQNQFMEVDASGKEIASHFPAGGDLIMKALKLPNGDIASVMFGGRFVELDPAGKEVRSFGVDVRTHGGRLDVQRDGHVIVPEMERNRVAEYNVEGKVVWETQELAKPIAAVRGPNGNTLINSMAGLRTVEVDRAGKVTWEYKSQTRVNRAFRR
jgi:HEAT repeat protein